MSKESEAFVKHVKAEMAKSEASLRTGLTALGFSASVVGKAFNKLATLPNLDK